MKASLSQSVSDSQKNIVCNKFLENEFIEATLD